MKTDTGAVGRKRSWSPQPQTAHPSVTWVAVVKVREHQKPSLIPQAPAVCAGARSEHPRPRGGNFCSRSEADGGTSPRNFLQSQDSWRPYHGPQGVRWETTHPCLLSPQMREQRLDTLTFLLLLVPGAQTLRLPPAAWPLGWPLGEPQDSEPQDCRARRQGREVALGPHQPKVPRHPYLAHCPEPMSDPSPPGKSLEAWYPQSTCLQPGILRPPWQKPRQ